MSKRGLDWMLPDHTGLRAPVRAKLRGFSRTTKAALSDPLSGPPIQQGTTMTNDTETENLSTAKPKRDRAAYFSLIATTLQGYGRQLSYDDPTVKAPLGLKHELREAASALDSVSITYTKKKDGLLLRTARGKSRYATMRERLAIWLLGGKTGIEV